MVGHVLPHVPAGSQAKLMRAMAGLAACQPNGGPAPSAAGWHEGRVPAACPFVTVAHARDLRYTTLGRSIAYTHAAGRFDACSVQLVFHSVVAERVVLGQLLHHRQPHLPRRAAVAASRRCRPGWRAARRERVAHPHAGDAPRHLLQRAADDAAQQVAVRQAAAVGRHAVSVACKQLGIAVLRACAPLESPQSPRKDCLPSSAMPMPRQTHSLVGAGQRYRRTRLQEVPSAFHPDTFAVTPRNILSATCVCDVGMSLQP